MLAIVGVALGVNVMIVVVTFMQGFQQKFRSDIIDAQGHARAVPLERKLDWRKDIDKVLSHSEVEKLSPYMQGHLLVQNRDYHAVPFSMGIEPTEVNGVLPMDRFLKKGFIAVEGYDSLDVTPVPSMELLEDEVVFITQQVANRLGVRAATILQLKDTNNSFSDGKIVVQRIDPFVPSDEWIIEFLSSEKFNFRSATGLIDRNGTVGGAFPNLGWGYPQFRILQGKIPFAKGDIFRFQTFTSSILEIYSPCLLYTSPSPRDATLSRMPSSA